MSQLVDDVIAGFVLKPETRAVFVPEKDEEEKVKHAFGDRLPALFWEFSSRAEEQGVRPEPMIRANRGLHEQPGGFALPEFLCAFFQKPDGDLLCFDLRAEGELPVVLWRRMLAAEENLANLTVVASSFEEWLQQLAGGTEGEAVKSGSSVIWLAIMFALLVAFLALMGVVLRYAGDRLNIPLDSPDVIEETTAE